MPATEEDAERLARFVREQYQRGNDAALLSGLHGAIDASDFGRKIQRSLELPGPESVTLPDLLAGLRLVPAERRFLDRAELDLIEAALERGATLTDLASEYQISPQGFGKRYRALGGTRELKPGPRPKSPGYTVTKWWIACTVEGLDDPHSRGEVQPKRPGPGQDGGVTYPVFGGGFAIEEPAEEGSVVYLGTLPDVGDDPEQGVVAVRGNENPGQITTTQVYVRAEHVPLEAK